MSHHQHQVLQALLVGFLLLFQRRRQLHKTLLGQYPFSLIGVKAQEHPVNLLISGFQPLAFFLRLGSVYQIPALHPAAQSLIKCVGIFESLCRQFLNVLQNKVIQIPCLDLMAGAGVLAQPVVGLADIIRLVNRLPHLAGKTVFSGSAHLFIPHLHGLSAGSTVNDTVEQVIEGTGVAFHNGRSAVND